MFAGRVHETFIELLPDEERLYRLPPMSKGPVIIRALVVEIRTGPHGEAVILPPAAPDDLDLELRHSEHLSLKSPSRFFTESLWHDDLWRLRVRRRRTSVDPAAPAKPRRYKIIAQYTSQLPLLERRIPASFFHDGFETNYNEQQYLKVRLIGKSIQMIFRQDFRELYGLQETYTIDTGRLAFDTTVDMTRLRFDVGAGPAPGGGVTPFFSIRADFPAVKVSVDVPGPNPDRELPPFHLTARLHLAGPDGAQQQLFYVPVFDSNLLQLLDFNVRVPSASAGLRTINVKDELKEKVESALFNLQVSGGTSSVFGAFLTPWLVGGKHELSRVRYLPGPDDQQRPDGVVEPATGEIAVQYVGPRPKSRVTGLPELTLADGGHGSSSPPVDDGAIPLFDLPDEEPDPEPEPVGGGGGFGGFPSPFGGPRPLPRDIGALANIDHIVVLMQENRSFDQVLGYLSRDAGRRDVDGLLPPEDPGHGQQVNRFEGRNFFPTRAQSTGWPRIPTAGNTLVTNPCHETECVRSQIENMGRFVADFARRMGTDDPSEPLAAAHLPLVMSYFGADDLPAYKALAREFAISDRWYCSHAGPTLPNRFVTLTGDLNVDPGGNVEEDNPDFRSMVPIQAPTLFDHLNDLGVSWRVFEHGYSTPRLFRNFTFETTNIVPFDDEVRGFEVAARTGNLPAVTFIEPDYIELPPGNDDHAPADMIDGQILVSRIVTALFDAPTWDRTLLIITYDEHGGFYDHKQPPTDAPPLRNSVGTLGPRVPAFFVSPWVEPEAVFFGKEDATGRRFDHTSIGATILRRFAGSRVPRVSPRLDAALDFRVVLNRATPRPRVETDLSELRELLSRPRIRAGAPRPPIGAPEDAGDFHWLLSAARLTTGQPPRRTRRRLHLSGNPGLVFSPIVTPPR